MRKRAKKIIKMFDDAVAAEQRYAFHNAKYHYKKIVVIIKLFVQNKSIFILLT